MQYLNFINVSIFITFIVVIVLVSKHFEYLSFIEGFNQEQINTMSIETLRQQINKIMISPNHNTPHACTTLKALRTRAINLWTTEQNSNLKDDIKANIVDKYIKIINEKCMHR